MADKRKGYKHGLSVTTIKGDPNPHVDTYKYKDRQTGETTSHKVKGSEMKVSKKPGKPGAGRQGGLNPKKDKFKPVIIVESKKKDKFKPVIIVESKAKGGRAGYNSGGAVLKGKKVGCQIK
jgi:hypothetical protein